MQYSTWYQINLILMAAFAGLLQGYQIGLIAGTELFLADEYRGIKKHENSPTTQEREFFVSFYSLGAALGVFIATHLNDWIGRKWTVFIGSTQVLIGFVIIILSGGILGGIFGRFVAGIGQGINSFAIPIWLTEVGMSTYTKITMALFQCFSGGGMIAGLNLCIPFRHHWRWLYIGGIFPIILLGIFMIFMPESPVYLIVDEKDDEVLEVLKRGLDD